MAQTPVPQNSSAVCLVCLFRMGVGNNILSLCATYIFHNHMRALALINLGYWLTVVALNPAFKARTTNKRKIQWTQA